MKKEVFKLAFTTIMITIINTIFINKLSNLGLFKSTLTSIFLIFIYFIIINVAFAIEDEYLK